MSELQITEIFRSIQGEGVLSGTPTTFIRLTGCNLHCSYCDTDYARKNGKSMTFQQIFETIEKYGGKYLTITGGEPLLQNKVDELITGLCDKNYMVSVETNGCENISIIDKRAMTVMDIKTPDSGESGNNRYSNFQYLKPKDQIKIVICSQTDYLWAKELINNHSLDKTCNIILSPYEEKVSPQELAQWLIDDKVDLKMQIQLHKYLWGAERRR
ncbi:MAG: radical SAM protein [Gammaproteobacteria bacterium]|nr:MAG: radical SAM protein [Gammaproteobacteria bacterium]